MRLRQDASSVPPDVLEKAANLFRVFGEDYHEKKLEEVFIFPIVKKTPGTRRQPMLMCCWPSTRADARSRITCCRSQRLIGLRRTVSSRWRRRWSRLCGCMSIMRRLKTRLCFRRGRLRSGEAELDELGEKFEEIEHEQFGGDGFEAALKRMEEIETSLGLSNLDMFTAPRHRDKIFQPRIIDARSKTRSLRLCVQKSLRYNARTHSNRTEGLTVSQGTSNLNL